ncbi:MAG: carbon-nitrogen hydrolase family protein, partial [Patescibacteria group bacterium]
MKIGYFQFLPEFLKIKNNFDKVEMILNANKAKIKGLELLVFPEYFLSGPLKIEYLSDYEKKISTEEIKNYFSKISEKFPKTTFVMGSVLLKINENYFNATLVCKNGKIIAEYRKKALIYNERYVCESDDNVSIFKVNNLDIGIAICWDLILPEIFRKYAEKIDLLILPSFWGIAGNALQARYSFSLEKKYYTAL